MTPFFRKPRSDILPPRPRKEPQRVGKVSHQVRLSGPPKSALREAVYLRAKGMCEIRLPGCGGYTPWKSGEMAHVRSVGSGGSDELANCVWSCQNCHRKSHNCGGKPCPAK